MRPHSRCVLLLLAASALAARALLVPAVPRASPLALRTLRDIAVVGARLGEMQQAVRPAAEYGTDAGDELRTLSSTLNASTAEMVSSLQALQLMVQKTRFDSRLLQEPAQPAEGLKALRGQASTLHRQIDEQRELLLLLEEQESGSLERAREVFSLMDVNNDGEVSEEEFLRGMTALLTLGKDEIERLRADVADRFRKGAGGKGTMHFDLFCEFLASLKGDAIGPLRVNLADASRRLLDNSLQMTSLSLSKALASPDLTPERMRELSACVDTWVELEGRANAAIAKGSTGPVQVTPAAATPPHPRSPLPPRPLRLPPFPSGPQPTRLTPGAP